MSSAKESTSVHMLVPLITVDDIEKSVAFYCDNLAFVVHNNYEPDGELCWCSLVRGGAWLMLQKACDEDGPTANRVQGMVFYILCDDADAMYAELSASGIKLDPPKVAFYGMNQLFLNDPDGYEICFQNETESS